MFLYCKSCDRKILPLRDSMACPYCGKKADKNTKSVPEPVTKNQKTIDSTPIENVPTQKTGKTSQSDYYSQSSTSFNHIVMIWFGWTVLVGFSVFACFRLFSWWLPPVFLNSILGVVVLGIVSTGSQSISHHWLNYVTRRRFKLSRANEIGTKLGAVPLFLIGFLLFWTIVTGQSTHPLLRNDFENLIRTHSHKTLEELGSSASSTHQIPGVGSYHFVPETTKQQVVKIILKRHGGRFKFKAALVMGLTSAAGSSLIWLSALLSNASKRSKSARVGSKQPRKPSTNTHLDEIAYFRSFNADASPANQQGAISAFSLSTEEELLAEAANALKLQLIAIGRPGEFNAEPGAERTYFSDEDWKKNAVRMMRESKLVIMRPDSTDALLWELTQAIKIVNPVRFALWIPKTMGNDWIDFIVISDSLFPYRLPARFSEFARTLRDRFVVFNSDWKPKELIIHSKKTEAKPWLKASISALLQRTTSGGEQTPTITENDDPY